MTFDTGFRRSPADHRDFDYRSLALSGVNAARKVYLPSKWSVDRYSPLPVYDQGQIPSCLGWAFAQLKTVHERKDKRRTLTFDGEEFYNRIALPGGGSYFRDALKVAAAEGLKGKGMVAGESDFKIRSYASVDPRDHTAVKHAIKFSRGVMIGFAVTKQWAQGGGAEFSATNSEILGGHGMFVSGYDRVGPIGLNSWGRSWSQDGRAPLPWEYWDKHVWECWTVTDLDD